MWRGVRNVDTVAAAGAGGAEGVWAGGASGGAADTFRCSLVQCPLVRCAWRGICALAMMILMNEALLGRITIDPEVCHGKPCIRGLRYPVESVLELLGSGMSSEEILGDYPDLEREDILAVLVYATRLAQVKRTVPAA